MKAGLDLLQLFKRVNSTGSVPRPPAGCEGRRPWNCRRFFGLESRSNLTMLFQNGRLEMKMCFFLQKLVAVIVHDDWQYVYRPESWSTVENTSSWILPFSDRQTRFTINSATWSCKRCWLLFQWHKGHSVIGDLVAEWSQHRTPVREVPESEPPTQLTSRDRPSSREWRRSRNLCSVVATSSGVSRSGAAQVQERANCR